jgi:predicted KAP-like P-loop ATPase
MTTEPKKDFHHYNDQPIKFPQEDLYGTDSFAAALARSIQGLKLPVGSVIGLNGPWGSGKSSVVNLILHHLKTAIDAKSIVVIRFECWWFRGEDALALAFFSELYAGLSPSLGDQLVKTLPKIGASLLRLGSVVSPAMDLMGTSGAGAMVSKAMDVMSSMITQNETVEKLHKELSKLLSEQSRRFLVVIDDIDRLSPDEALLIFRLVKSVGQLPNVIYLLVYDRLLAEKIVRERFPSEGPQYLEKIVQASFELPEPQQSDLCNQLLQHIEFICGTPVEEELDDFMQNFYAIVAPELRTPRDVARIANALSVTWPAVRGEVHLGDFVALEIIRLLHAEMYRAIRINKDQLCGSSRSNNNTKKDDPANWDKMLLRGVDDQKLLHYRRILMRLFPRLQGIWNNNNYGDDWTGVWARGRRVCSEKYFDAYFRFTLGDEVLPKSEVDALIARSDDSNFITTTFREAIKKTVKSGGTKAKVILDELSLQAERIEQTKVLPFLKTIFKLADELDVEVDQVRYANNNLRLHWLLRKLTFDRISLPDRSAIFKEACKDASLGWLVDFARSARNDHYPWNKKPPQPEEKCLMTDVDTKWLKELAVGKIVTAAQNGQLLSNRRLATLLYSWRDLAGDAGKAVRSWTTENLDNDITVATFANAFTSYGWSHSMGFGGLGDVVAKRTIQANVEIDSIIDKCRFLERLETLEKIGEYPEVSTYLSAMRQREMEDK